VWLLLWGLAGPSAAAESVAHGSRLQLGWELQRQPGALPTLPGSAPARFTLTNRDIHPLPAAGWSLYFNAMDRLPAEADGGAIRIEHVAGYLFRLRPGAAFGGLAPGQTLQIAYRHPDNLYMPAKAPAGPYLVYDAAPEVGVKLAAAGRR
jgi:hexosaminidase